MITDIPTKELAQFLGVQPAFVSHIKRMRRKLPAKYCVQVSIKYGIPLHDLRPDIYPPNPYPCAPPAHPR